LARKLYYRFVQNLSISVVLGEMEICFGKCHANRMHKRGIFLVFNSLCVPMQGNKEFLRSGWTLLKCVAQHIEISERQWYTDFLREPVQGKGTASAIWSVAAGKENEKFIQAWQQKLIKWCRGLGSAPPQALADIPERSVPLLPIIGETYEPVVAPTADLPEYNTPLGPNDYDDVVYIPGPVYEDYPVDTHSHVGAENSIGGVYVEHSLPDDFDFAFYNVDPVYAEPHIPVTVLPPSYDSNGKIVSNVSTIPAKTNGNDKMDYSGTAPKYKPRSNAMLGSRRIPTPSVIEEVSTDPYHNFTTAADGPLDYDNLAGDLIEYELTPTEPPDDIIDDTT